MGRRIVQVTRLGGGGVLLALEALLLGLIVGTWLHQKFPKMHLALVLTLGILTAIVLFVLVLRIVMIFWLWTATLAGGIGYSILRDVQDKGWALFWAAVTVLLIVEPTPELQEPAGGPRRVSG